MIATDDKIYRLTKDENGFRVLLQYIDSLDDLYDTWGVEETTPFVTNRNPITALTASPNAWTMVGNPNGSSKWQIPGLNGGNLEGPLVFKDNTEDMWYVFIDYASGGGYVAWRSDTMDKPPNEWEYLGQSWCNTTGLSTACTAQSATSPLWSLPVSPRHGSVLPITSEEWEAVMTAYNSPVHVEASVVKADGTVVKDGAWVNEVPKLKVKWTDFNGTGLAPAWLQLIEGHNGGPRVISPERITTGIVQGMTLPVNAAEGTNWAQVEYRDASLGGDAVRLWTPDVSYKMDTIAPVLESLRRHRGQVDQLLRSEGRIRRQRHRRYLGCGRRRRLHPRVGQRVPAGHDDGGVLRQGQGRQHRVRQLRRDGQAGGAVRQHRRRQRSGDARAHPGRAGLVRPVHPGRGQGLLRHHHGDRDLDRRRRDPDGRRPVLDATPATWSTAPSRSRSRCRPRARPAVPTRRSAAPPPRPR